MSSVTSCHWLILLRGAFHFHFAHFHFTFHSSIQGKHVFLLGINSHHHGASFWVEIGRFQLLRCDWVHLLILVLLKKENLSKKLIGLDCPTWVLPLSSLSAISG
jgi:hypothetical protein